LENAVESVNSGADAYITKPIKPERLFAILEEKLEEQRQTERMTEEQVTEWIKTRVRRLETAG
jgi:DNA-binding NtrC family response regulator